MAKIIVTGNGQRREYELGGTSTVGGLNGSFLRGERVSEHVLEDGGEITLGSTRLTFQERSATDSVLQRVTIAPSMKETRPRASSCRRARSPTSRCCGVTTRSCVSPTSSGARSASR